MDPPNSTWPSPTTEPWLLPMGILFWDGQLLVACASLGLPANAITLWLTGWQLRCRGLATFIFSLAASDFLFLASSLLTIYSLANGHQWLLDTHSCRLYKFLYALGYYSSLFLLATISLDRCLLVAAPLWYRCRRPRWLSLALCVGAWLVAAGCSVPNSAMASAQEVLPEIVVCRSERGSWERPLRWLEVLGEGLLPFTVVVVCHTVALALASCRRGHGGRPPVRFQRIVVATMTLYVVLHLPFQVVQMMQLIDPENTGHFLYLLGLAFNLSSCANPYVYLLFGSQLGQRIARWATSHLACSASTSGATAVMSTDGTTTVSSAAAEATPVPPSATSAV